MRLKNRFIQECLFQAVLALQIISGLSIMCASEPTSPALQLLASQRPLVIGHRGYCQVAPENTLPSFKLAMAAGADLVELDYHLTKDGKLIVIHDSELDRTTDATNRWKQPRIKVASRTAADIQSLDAGSWFGATYSGTRLPLLTEALDAIQAGSITLIEAKAGPAADCVRLLQEKGLINRVVVQSFDWNYVRAFHELAPEQVLGALGPPSRSADGKKLPEEEKVLNSHWLDQVQKTGAKVAVWNDQVTREAIQLAHERGLRVWVYTINDPDRVNQMLDLGVDAIITNNTALVWKTIALRNSKTP